MNARKTASPSHATRTSYAEQDWEQAFKCFKAAAVDGNPDGAYRVARLALHFCKRVSSADALHRCYWEGLGVKRNLVKAYELLSTLANGK